jgi:hypothetical protein
VAVHVVCVIRHIQALKRGTVLVFKKSEHVHILPGVVPVLFVCIIYSNATDRQKGRASVRRTKRRIELIGGD